MAGAKKDLSGLEIYKNGQKKTKKIHNGANARHFGTLYNFDIKIMV